jgi:hypothetical protein
MGHIQEVSEQGATNGVGAGGCAFLQRKESSNQKKISMIGNRDEKNGQEWRVGEGEGVCNQALLRDG